LNSESHLEFSITYSGDLVLFAFTAAGRIGVDVERIVPLKAMDELENWFMSDDEKKLSADLSPYERIETFYKLWTVKEAYLKMLGRGLIDDLNALNMVPALSGKESAWSLDVFSPMSGYLAALVKETMTANVVRFKCKLSDFING
jgi:phosphopantetheine--protein transferase-like protein